MARTRHFCAFVIALGFAGCGVEEPVPSPTPSPAPAPSAKGPASTPGPKAAAPAPAPTPGEAKKIDAPPPLEPPKTGDAKDAVKPVALTDAQIAKIKKLPEAEQDAAIKQAVCPVSGEHLGSMGAPIKITAEGRTFYLCCQGCEDDVKTNPKSVIAKLDKK